MASNKREIFGNPHELEQFVLNNFHGYFQHFRQPVKEWFHLLVLAHQFRSFEYHGIHDMVLEILDRTLVSLPPDDINKMGQKVLENRKANIKTLSSNPFGKVQRPPPVHTSPTSQRQGAAGAVCYSHLSSPTPAPASKKKKLLGGK